MTLKFNYKNQLRHFKSLRLTGWVIWTLEKIHGDTSLDSTLANLRTLEEGTIGREVAELLDRNGYRLIPKFENHDLKHIVLDYGMTMEDELKMQAYLVGNGNTTLPCLIFLSFSIFYPKIWKDLRTEFNQGKNSNSIHFLTLENCMNQSLIEIKNKYGRKNLPLTSRVSGDYSNTIFT